jgi:hypothetical protein
MSICRGNVLDAARNSAEMENCEPQIDIIQERQRETLNE